MTGNRKTLRLGYELRTTVMDNLIFSLNATIPIFLTMVVGYILKQIHMLDEPFVKTLNKFNYNIVYSVQVKR